MTVTYKAQGGHSVSERRTLLSFPLVDLTQTDPAGLAHPLVGLETELPGCDSGANVTDHDENFHGTSGD